MNISLSLREISDIHNGWKSGKINMSTPRPVSIALRISKNLTSLHAAYIEAMHLRDEYEKEHGTPEVLSDDYELEHYLVTTTLDISLDPVALSEAGESITLDEMSVLYFMISAE